MDINSVLKPVTKYFGLAWYIQIFMQIAHLVYSLVAIWYGVRYGIRFSKTTAYKLEYPSGSRYAHNPIWQPKPVI